MLRLGGNLPNSQIHLRFIIHCWKSLFKIQKHRFNAIGNIWHQSFIFVDFLIVELEFHILNSKISFFCIIWDCFKHILIFSILQKLSRNIGIISGKINKFPEPPHSIDTRFIIHRAGHREKQLVFCNRFTNHSALWFGLSECEFLILSCENNCFLPFGRMIQWFRNDPLSRCRKRIPILYTIQNIYKRKLCWLLFRIIV